MAANINSNLASWSVTESSNAPAGTDSSDIDAEFRLLQAVVRKYLASKGADIASAATVDLSAATGNYVHITGTTTITSLGTVSAGMRFMLVFDGALTFTHNATSLILPGAANITTAAGDRCEVVSLGSGNWRCSWFTKASGLPVVGSYLPLAGGTMTGSVVVGESTGATAITLTGTTTGGTPSIVATGTDTDIDLKLTTKGTGVAQFVVAGALALEVVAPVSPVNRQQIGSSAAGQPLTYEAIGTDADISINMKPKGAGVLQVNGTAVPSVASTAETKTGTSTTKAVTPAGLLNGLGVSANYSWVDIVITTGGTLVVAHGQSRSPKIVTLWLICTTTEHGYSIGDKLLSQVYVTDAAPYGVSLTVDATYLTLRFANSATVFQAANKNTGAYVYLTNASWTLTVEAFF
jgi:hypothetical protein